MKFNEWLRKERNVRRMDVRAFAEWTQVDPSTISRIENAHTEATLYTAYRICTAMHIPLSQFYYDLTGLNLNSRYEISVDKGSAVSMDDLGVFIYDLKSDREAIYKYLAYVYNEILEMGTVMQEGILKRLSSFDEIAMEVLLSNNSMNSFDLNYPRQISYKAVIYNYEKGGILILPDVGAYVRGLRREEKVTLEILEGSSRISTSVLSRLEEGSLERIKLVDILALDISLNQAGRILDMFWEACSDEEQIFRRGWLDNSQYDFSKNIRKYLGGEQKSNNNSKLINFYIKVCRWYQHLKGTDFLWPKYRWQKG